MGSLLQVLVRWRAVFQGAAKAKHTSGLAAALLKRCSARLTRQTFQAWLQVARQAAVQRQGAATEQLHGQLAAADARAAAAEASAADLRQQLLELQNGKAALQEVRALHGICIPGLLRCECSTIATSWHRSMLLVIVSADGAWQGHDACHLCGPAADVPVSCRVTSISPCTVTPSHGALTLKPMKTPDTTFAVQCPKDLEDEQARVRGAEAKTAQARQELSASTASNARLAQQLAAAAAAAQQHAQERDAIAVQLAAANTSKQQHAQERDALALQLAAAKAAAKAAAQQHAQEKDALAAQLADKARALAAAQASSRDGSVTAAAVAAPVAAAVPAVAAVPAAAAVTTAGTASAANGWQLPYPAAASYIVSHAAGTQQMQGAAMHPMPGAPAASAAPASSPAPVASARALSQQVAELHATLAAKDARIQQLQESAAAVQDGLLDKQEQVSFMEAYGCLCFTHGWAAYLLHAPD